MGKKAEEEQEAVLAVKHAKHSVILSVWIETRGSILRKFHKQIMRMTLQNQLTFDIFPSRGAPLLKYDFKDNVILQELVDW